MPWYSGPVPDSHITSRLRFVPLTEDLVDADLAAVMASREYLRRWSDSPWPEDDFTRADNEEDLRDHRREHEDGVAFTYSVLAARVERVVGCVYIRPLADALETRDVDVSTDTVAVAVAVAEIVPDAAVVRGWIRSDEPAGTPRRARRRHPSRGWPAMRGASRTCGGWPPRRCRISSMRARTPD